MAKIAESFFDLNLITVNATKSDLIVLNSVNTMEENVIDFVDSRLIPHEPDSVIQYLGLTDKQVRYIINQVLFSQIEYLLTDMVLGETIKNELNVSIKKCFKSVIEFSVALLDSVLYSHWDYRLFNIEDRQIQLHATELMNRLNMNNKCGIITRMCLQDLQNYIWSTNSIWQMKLNTWKGISKRELNREILELLAANEIQIEITDAHKFPITPMGENISIEEFMQSNGHIDKIIPNGYAPNWFNELKTELENRRDEIRRGRQTNPFNRIIKLDQAQIKKDQLVAIKTNTDALIGRIYRNLRENISTIPIYHYVSDPMDGITGSPVAPCKGYDLAEHELNANMQIELSPIAIAITNYFKKMKKDKNGVTEIGDDNDDAPLTRKETKIFFKELKKEISDIRKLLEMSGVEDYTTEESFIKKFVGEIASYSINKYIYPNKKELKKFAGAIFAKSYPEYFEHWKDDRWKLKKEISDIRKLLEMSGVEDYTTEESFIKLLAKHRSRRGAITIRVRSSFFSTFGESDLPTINIKSAASEVLSWKKFQKVKDILRKLNQDIDDHENLTCPKVESIKIDDEAIRKRMKKNIVNKESESEEKSSEEEEKKGEEKRLGEERILEEERGRKERQEREKRRETWDEELIEIISGGPKREISDIRKLLASSEIESDCTTENEFINKVANSAIDKRIYLDESYLKSVVAGCAELKFHEYFGSWENKHWSSYYTKYIQSLLLAKHRNLRGSIANRVRSALFTVFGEHELLYIDTKSASQEIKE
ncbi:hypothetical protein Glove_88g117 [Diversispora epigaea]|uniref:Uncharacterized protein n=1 Tax=Diversispora epigaea TaxID=1348612 RepID=A0A397J9J4_9GLOM|nr:hypothetical protein Glove_88g117 [Diversispora epigaea]